MFHHLVLSTPVKKECHTAHTATGEFSLLGNHFLLRKVMMQSGSKQYLNSNHKPDLSQNSALKSFFQLLIYLFIFESSGTKHDRITIHQRLEETLVDDLVQCPCQITNTQVSHTGTCPGGFRMPPEEETGQPTWAACSKCSVTFTMKKSNA